MINDIRALVQRQQVGGAVIASIGGFDVQYCGGPFGEEGYRYMTVLARTGAETEIDLPVAAAPLGAIARVEHVLDSFEEEQQRARHHLTDAERRLASYRSREGGTFGFAGDLAEKRLQLAEIEKSLAADVNA
jgi:hypothetical protein